MKILSFFILMLLSFQAFSQAETNGPNGLVHWRDTGLIHGSGGIGTNWFLAKLDVTKPPYNLTAGSNGSVAVQQAVDSLWNTYKGGYVYIPVNLNWPRPGGTQKGVILRPNIHIVGNGNRLTMTGDNAFFTTDFGTDSLGTTITADVDSFMTNIQVASSTGFLVGDTIYFRLTTAPYDAGEPLYFGYRKIRAIPDGTHITLDAPTGGLCTVASTSSLNKRIIRIHNLCTNASISNLELYNDGNVGAGHIAEAGVYIQGGWNITLDRIRATNPGAGIAVFQFCKNCILQNSTLDSNANTGNANFGRGITMNECEICGVVNTVFNSYQQTGFVNESTNINSYCTGCTFNNNFNDSPRVAITTLGSGTFSMTNTRFQGFSTSPYNSSQAVGNMIFQNANVQKGTPITNFYEQQGLSILPPYKQSDGDYYLRKRFTYKFNMPVNASYSFDSLPKGLMLNVNVTVDDTTGITAFYLRRDGTFTNNGVDFHTSLRPGQGVNPSGMGASFQVGNNLASTTLNYNEDKSFLVTTNSTANAGKTGTLTFEYLEKNNSTLLNRYNYVAQYDASTVPIARGGTGTTTSTGSAGSVVLSASPTVTGVFSTPKVKGTSTAPGIAAGTGAGTSPTVSLTGTDLAGVISVTTGTGPNTAATFATITYNVAYSSKPYVILTPANSATAALAVGVVYTSDGSNSTSSFVLNTGSVAPAASTAYLWYYHVIQ